MKFFRIHFLLVYLLFSSFSFVAQNPQTIKIKKESNLAKAVLDNTQNRLVVIDRYGNPKENKIMGYKLYVKSKRETKEFEGFSNGLTAEMVNYLNKQSSACKIFFTEVSAMDDQEHVVKLPDVIDTWFPDCRNCDPSRGTKKRNSRR